MNTIRCISIWNPFATLLVRGFKIFETRGWPAPASLIGQRIGIASTKVITPAQRAHFNDPDFRRFYDQLVGVPDNLAEMPNGYMLGYATLEESELMTPEFLDDVSAEEKAYGWWSEGRYAWRMTDPVAFERPYPVRGKQGIWTWTMPEDDDAVQVPRAVADLARYKAGRQMRMR